MSVEERRRGLEVANREMAEKIKRALPEGVGFVLLLFEFGPDGWLSYSADGEREDVFTTLLEWMLKMDEATTRAAIKRIATAELHGRGAAERTM